MRFDILNRLGVDHECDGQTDRRTDRGGDSNSACRLPTLSLTVTLTVTINSYRYSKYLYVRNVRGEMSGSGRLLGSVSLPVGDVMS